MNKTLGGALFCGLLFSGSASADGIVLGTVKDDAELIKGVNRCQGMVDTLKSGNPAADLSGRFHIQAVLDYVGKNPTSYQEGQEITRRVLKAANGIAIEQMIATCQQRTGAVLHELAMNKAHEMRNNARELIKGF